jgi:hypothetical protein
MKSVQGNIILINWGKLEMLKEIEYVVEAGIGCHKWLAMRTYYNLELALIDSEEIQIEEDTQTRIKVYEVEYYDTLECLLTKSKQVKSRELLEIL